MNHNLLAGVRKRRKSKVTPTITANLSPSRIDAGQTSTLSWSTTNATSVTIDNGIGSVGTSGSIVVSPTTATNYIITATNGNKSASTTLRLIVDEVILFNDATHFVTTFAFEAINGRDLDINVQMVQPVSNIGAVGFASGGFGTATKILANGRTPLYNAADTNQLVIWSGDNTGYGKESVYVDINAIKQLYPTATTIRLAASADWYGERGNGNMYFSTSAFKGGTTSLNTNFEFANSGSARLGYLDSIEINTPKGSTSPVKYSIGAISYNLQTGAFTYIPENKQMALENNEFALLENGEEHMVEY